MTSHRIELTKFLLGHGYWGGGSMLQPEISCISVD